jgi:hypothetical protein
VLLKRVIAWAVVNPLVAAAFVGLFFISGFAAWQTVNVERVKTKLAVSNGQVEALRTTAQLRAIEVERLIESINAQNSELTRLETLAASRAERVANALTLAADREAELIVANQRIAQAEIQSCAGAVALAREEIGI